MPDPAERNGSGCCCRYCCKVIFSLGLSSLVIWLSLRTSNPKCSLQYFYLPALNKSLNNPNDTTLQFQLKLRNPNTLKGIYYHDLNVTIFDSPNRSHVVGSSIIPGFYQGYKKTAGKYQTAEIDKEVVSRPVSANGSAVFRVDLVTTVRFKMIVWKIKRHKIIVGADVEVNDRGTKVNTMDIRLTSSAAIKINYFVLVGFLLKFLLLILLN